MVSCDIVRGFPVRKIMWLHNGEQILVQNVENGLTQAISHNNMSGMTAKDKSIDRLKQALSTSFTSVSSSSTILPFISTAITNPSTRLMSNRDDSHYKPNDHISFEGNGKVA